MIPSKESSKQHYKKKGQKGNGNRNQRDEQKHPGGVDRAQEAIKSMLVHEKVNEARRGLDPLVGKDLKQIVEANKKQNKELQFLKDQFKDTLRSNQSYSKFQALQALKKIVVEKTGGEVKNKYDLLRLKDKLGIRIPDLELLQLIAIDDWSSILGGIVNHLPLIGDIAKGIGSIFSGHDAGGDPRDNMILDGQALVTPTKYTYMPGVNAMSTSSDHSSWYAGSKSDVLDRYSDVDSRSTGLGLSRDSYRSVDSFRGSAASYSGINTDYLATVICPEHYAARSPHGNGVVRSHLTHIKDQFIITTDTAGNGAFWFDPWNVGVLAANSGKDAGGYVQHPAYTGTYDPTVGTASAYIWRDGPLSAQIAGYEALRVVSYQVSMTPITSANNSQGEMILALLPNNLGWKLNSATVFPITALQNTPYCQRGNFLTVMRSCGIPAYGIAGTTLNANDGFLACSQIPSDQWNVLQFGMVTGCAPSANVVRVDIDITVELIPTPIFNPTVVLDCAGPGNGTMGLIKQMFTMYPMVECMLVEDALKLACIVKDSDPNWDYVWDNITRFMTGFAPLGKATRTKSMSIPLHIVKAMGRSKSDDSFQL